ncbi:DNA-directed RNA polymerase II complex subunit Rpb11 (nucleomorph) [Cryptomonas paramecium]|uniref:DNA-directed RNA polymerase II complex subunit Rpb11 n=1 Tax=Cryptomonas paramaecium TaxID=2898 RepID=F2HIF7_9CRYP|nr:DNA-directed RNA polymerase II complex subunit Rpb11 [Cryptomonas paramecium]AEA39081.1 DNA-directed RNA polymerase II complex subunit Rpb11 [Cryptomonas paramecium]|mmetsp:Transcript_37353/g.99466  ORF Transcript_37353/g.99466 Transcript_37353/m.99466 type:complete len:102 (-) Transcript_37353:14146-14451(-)
MHSFDLDKTRKIEFYKDKDNVNYGSFRIKNEDHTIGSLIQKQLLKHPDVIFSGYKKFHPLEKYIFLKIITNGHKTPIQVLDSVLKDLYIQFSLLEEEVCNM